MIYRYHWTVEGFNRVCKGHSIVKRGGVREGERGERETAGKRERREGAPYIAINLTKRFQTRKKFMACIGIIIVLN